MHAIALWPLVIGACVALALANPTPTTHRRLRRTNVGPQFVSTTSDGRFVVNGAPFRFIGTNAYWLPTLNTEEDIDRVLANISAAGITVVRTWAFNDVTTVPENGTWFQLINNGTFTVNEGPNGLQKLDKVVELAEKHGIYLLLSLTNNWNPLPSSDDVSLGADPVRRQVTPGTNDTRPRNTLSNDYGGMDVYVREFGLEHHNEFYTNETVVDAFMNYTTQIVRRYCKSPAVFGWELANDPRCNSTIPASSCNPQDITRWHATVSEHIRSIDTNHLVSSGSGGYLCLDCPKLFPPTPATPPPAPSPAPGSSRRRSLSKRPLTKASILRDRAALWKRNRLAKRQITGGIRIRGRWTSAPTRRQEDTQAVGPAYDGSFGVDSQDIMGAPGIDFGSFQLFPDQFQYGPDDPTLSRYENMVQQGNAWIEQQAQAAAEYGKPSTLNAFGLVTEDNAPNFVPFDSSVAPFGSDSGGAGAGAEAPFGVTDQQRDDAYNSWINTGLTSDLTSMIQYQWSQDGLTVSPGTTVSVSPGSTGVTTSPEGTGVSPNDGYAINGAGREETIDVIREGIARFGSDSSL